MLSDLKYRAWILLLLCLLSPGGEAAIFTCPESFSALLSERYDSEEGYECGFCFYNAGELAREAKKRFGAEIEVAALNVMVIKNKRNSDPTGGLENTPLSHYIVARASRGETDSDEGMVLWKYHAVVEYKGRIMDLDLKAPIEAVPAAQYFDSMFAPVRSDLFLPHSQFPDERVPKMRDYNRWKDMEVFLLPANDYIREFKRGRPVPRPGNMDFVWKKPSQGLLEYLKRYR